jgi:hypothetical protein
VTRNGEQPHFPNDADERIPCGEKVGGVPKRSGRSDHETKDIGREGGVHDETGGK